MSDAKQISKLADLTGVSFRAAQAEYSRLIQEEELLRGRLAQLDEDRNSSLDDRVGRVDPAIAAGVDPLWHRWIEDRRVLINNEIARLRAMQIAARSRLKRAYGREQAMKNLLSSAKLQARAQKQRRADYES